VHEICTYTRSSIVIPACANTSFSPSSRILISSSTFSALSLFSDPIQSAPPDTACSLPNAVAERRLYWPSRQFDHFARRLRRRLRNTPRTVKTPPLSRLSLRY